MSHPDTIAAISTGLVESAIGIVRLSGPKAWQIFAKIARQKKRPPARSVKFCKIVEPHTKKTLDDCLFVHFPKPNSYTGEDVIEIFCHGSLPVLNTLLDLCLRNNARLAEPGEFTKRAFLNGKLDLAQAESVQELISAKTNIAAETAVEGINGVISLKIQQVRQKLVEILAHLEAALDFPDEIDFISDSKLNRDIDKIQQEIGQIFSNSQRSRIFQQGVTIAIVGKPNVGKSTLLNCFLGQERAITSHLPGTTRDTIEELIDLDGIPAKLIDTAGLRKANDDIEHQGIKRSEEKIRQADLILCVLDIAKAISQEDKKIFQRFPHNKVIIAANKCDLQKKHTLATLPYPSATISAKTGRGIAKLVKLLKTEILKGIPARAESIALTNTRQLKQLEKAGQSLDHLIATLKKNMPLDCLAVDLKAAIVALGQITGENVSQEVINNIFEKFCVGK
ncbi:MAG: tRNA uridine-5-carboxymethylaminomethyl(34) synthesis GTPase MnmE [Candidatus Margulisiibacteriota bacterium]|jgi:tRNA modification GTPase